METLNAHEFYVSAMKGTAQNDTQIAENKRLVAKFPWLWPSDWNWNPISQEEYDYSWTVLDEFPEGWKNSFAEAMCTEIQNVLEKYSCVNGFHIDQLKEKYGSMRLYFSGVKNSCYDELSHIIDKYESISERTCCKCGKPATRISQGWICPFCDDCSHEFVNETVPIS